MINQKNKSKYAGTFKTVTKIKINTKVLILLLGKRAKYAPNTPATAPEAPSMGIELVGVIKYWVKPAATPEAR